MLQIDDNIRIIKQEEEKLSSGKESITMTLEEIKGHKKTFKEGHILNLSQLENREETPISADKLFQNFVKMSKESNNKERKK